MATMLMKDSFTNYSNTSVTSFGRCLCEWRVRLSVIISKNGSLTVIQFNSSVDVCALLLAIDEVIEDIQDFDFGFLLPWQVRH